MKSAMRVFACTLLILAAAAGNFHAKTASGARIIIANVPGGGPIPMCNPFVQNCPKSSKTSF